LRHVSAEAFVEDPLRVFRVARFSAQLPDFTVSPETLALMTTVDTTTLSAERVFKETEKALRTEHHRNFFEVLMACGQLSEWFPELKACKGVPAGHPDKHGSESVWEHLMKASEVISKSPAHLKYAVLCHDLGKAVTDPVEWPKHHRHDSLGLTELVRLNVRLKVPTKYREASTIFMKEHMRIHKIFEMKPGKAVRLLLRLEKTFPGGLSDFLVCAVGDGFSREDCLDLLYLLQGVQRVKLPKEYYGRGEACGQILLNLRAMEYKRLKKELM
jgi:tRNA nucleotidyltransferase (CCA-adding enzyme)